MNDSEILGRVAQLEAELKELRRKPKDRWDKLSSLSGFLSGAIIGGIGLYATATYNARQLDAQNLQKGRELIVQRVQTVEKFFPHLSSDKENVRKAAFEVIAILGDESLAVNYDSNFTCGTKRGGRSTLKRGAAGSDPAAGVQLTMVMAHVAKMLPEKIYWRIDS